MIEASFWNPLQARLKTIVEKPGQFEEAIRLCLEMHSTVHTSEMSGRTGRTFEDELWDGLTDKAFRTMPTAKDDTIAWDIWHLTRIEDLVSNILIAGGSQVLDDEWHARLNTKVTDTGNAMSDDEIISLSGELNMAALRDYRITVGRRTRSVLTALETGEMKRKMKKESLKRILDEGGVLEAEGSKWLLDFWGRKTVAGLLLMPITRHQVVHINDALRLKKRIGKTG